MPDDDGEGNRLSSMHFDEISLVTRGANQPALVTLWKGQPGPEDVHQGSTKKVVKGSKAADGHTHQSSGVNGAAGISTCETCGAQLVDKADGLTGDDPQNISKKYLAVVRKAAKGAVLTEDEIALFQEMEEAITNGLDSGDTIDPASGNQSGGKNVPEEDPKVKPIDKSALDPTVVAYIEKLEKDAADSLAAVTKKDDEVKTLSDRIAALETAAKKDEPTDPIEKALSKMDPDVRELFKAQQDESKRQAEIIKAQQDEAATNVAISKVAGWSKLPTTPAQFGPIWKAISDELSPEVVTFMETMFASINEQLRQKGNILQTIGKVGNGGTDSSSTVSKLEGMAVELKKLDPNLTNEQAKAAALKAHPEMYDEYLAELKAARAGR